MGKVDRYVLDMENDLCFLFFRKHLKDVVYCFPFLDNSIFVNANRNGHSFSTLLCLVLGACLWKGGRALLLLKSSPLHAYESL
jgi:hypothetical protein